MTRALLGPEMKGGRISAWSPRLGISHPFGEKIAVRFFYGRSNQFPNFQGLFWNVWVSNSSHDKDLNGNGAIDPAERWNTFDPGTGEGVSGSSIPNPYLLPRTTTSFELGWDWNFVADYVVGVTTYYKSGSNREAPSQGRVYASPITGRTVSAPKPIVSHVFTDARGIEVSIKKRFSKMFALNAALNLQWSDSGGFSWNWLQSHPDSLMVANGHIWGLHDIDPTTGAEIPVSLREQAIREGRDPDYYIVRYGATANRLIREYDLFRQGFIGASWSNFRERNAEAGFDWGQGAGPRDSYTESDRVFWEMVNATPGYPGTGEGNMFVAIRGAFPRARDSTPEDRRAFGSLAFLLSTPPDYGPWAGRALGNVRTNLVYRFYTGTPFDGPTAKGVSSTSLIVLRRKYGPIHTRVDLDVQKQFGESSGVNATFGIQVYNLFNQKDFRSWTPGNGRDIDFGTSKWQLWGMTGLDPISASRLGTQEIFDVNNYWDQPREMIFSLRIKW